MHSLLLFVIIGSPPRPYLSLIVFPLISNRLDTILGSTYVYTSSILFPMIGTPSRFNPFSFVFSTRFSSLGQLCRFYYFDSFFPFVTNHWDAIHWFLTVWTPSRFDGSLFFLPLVSHLCDHFVASFYGHSFFNLVCHYWDAP